jgi:DNA polymerase-3 subunit gamma/tau
LQNFCRRLLAHFRNLMVLKAGVTESALLGVPESLVSDLRMQADLFSREDLLRLFDALLKVEADLKSATQMRFQLEMGLIEVAHLKRLRSLEDLIADFTQLVGGQPPGRGEPAHTSSPAGGSRPTTSEHKTESKEALLPVAEPRGGSSFEGRDLLLKIAAGVNKASLESVLQGIPSAELRGDEVQLDLGSVNDFLRRQIRENLPLLIRAASSAVGRPVRVIIGDEAGKPVDREVPPVPADNPAEDALERARREPVVQSFLEVFPGPVKAERIDK